MSSQILDRSLQLALNAAMRDTYDAFETAIGRLRTVDRHSEIPPQRYLAMEAIAHTRAGHLPEAKRVLAKLADLDESMAEETKRLLLSAPESRHESFRRFVREAIPEVSPANAEDTSPRRKRLRWAIAGTAMIVVVIGAVLTIVLLSRQPSSPVGSQPDLDALPARSHDAESRPPQRVSVPLEDSGLGAMYDRLSGLVCKVVLRVEVLLDSGQTVRVPASSGTGFVVSRDGLILTNAHVVDGGRDLMEQYSEIVGWDLVLAFGGRDPLVLEGGVVQQSTTVDLAWIRVNHEFDQALGFGRPPAPGQTVMVYGFPGVASRLADEMNLGELKQRASKIDKAMESGNELDLIEWLGPNSMTLIVTSGITSAWHDTEKGLMLQTDAFIHYGNSGGPVLDEAGRVVGIATLGATVVESANMCLAGQTIHEELAHERGIVWPDSW